MDRRIDSNDLNELAPSGYHIALRVGFAFPMEEENTFPSAWIEHYSQQHFVLFDPVMHWMFQNQGYARWSEIDIPDPRRVLFQAQSFGLKHGVMVSYLTDEPQTLRSFGSFTRSDRPFDEIEMQLLFAFVKRRHLETAPPSNLTNAELEVLRMIKDGRRLKEIAHVLGVSEGAIKQRLKNAKRKLDAKTGPQAAALANQYGII